MNIISLPNNLSKTHTHTHVHNVTTKPRYFRDFSHTTADNRRRICSETLCRPDFPTIFYSSITRGPRGVAKKKKGEISKLGVHARMVARRRRRWRARQGVLIYDSSQQRATWSGYIQAHARLREPRVGRVGGGGGCKERKTRRRGINGR